MPLGPGKYGARAEQLLREVGAQLVIVITIDGAAGSAFDVATSNPALLAELPAILHRTAERVASELNTDGPIRG